MSPLVSPSQTVKPVVLGEFSVRIDGVWIVVAVSEAVAWKKFIEEKRSGRRVELLRGSKVMAHLNILDEGEKVLS